MQKLLWSQKGSSLTDLLLGNFSLTGITSSLADNTEFASMIVPVAINAVAEVAADPLGKITEGLFKKAFLAMDKNDDIKRINNNIKDFPILMRNYLENGDLDKYGGFIGKVRDSKPVKWLTGDESVSGFLLKNIFGGDLT